MAVGLLGVVDLVAVGAMAHVIVTRFQHQHTEPASNPSFLLAAGVAALPVVAWFAWVLATF